MIQSTNQHGIHSPYLFEFYNQVISDKRNFYEFEKLEAVRKSYFRNQNPLDIVDLGAGSSYNNSKSKTISEIAKQQLSGSYQLQVIFRMIDWLQTRTDKQSLNLIELGASLGLSTFYLASVSKKNKVYSFEGNPHFVKFIEYQKQHLNYHNIEMIVGDFDNTFRAFAQKDQDIDLAFIDGNHREKETIEYFEWALNRIQDHSILVFDDIHWSVGMKRAWKYISNHPRVTASIDMYFMGIVFFRKDFQQKRQLKIRPLSIR